MSFFNPFKKSSEKDLLNQDIIKFEQEVLATIPRYISKPDASVQMQVRHQETNKIISFAEGFPEQFEPWKKTKSIADKRGLIYSLLDSQIGNNLDLWKIIERFNDDRYPQKALEIALTEKQEIDEIDPNYWNALAKTYFILTQYESAEKSCLKAIKIDAENIRTKRIYADILHTTNRHEEAHKIYNEILEIKLPKDKPMNLAVQNLLGFDGDIVNSPIYAFNWLKSDNSTTKEIWEWANEEFYYSPHFRSQYAIYLVEKNEHMAGFVKFLVLSREMPWFKEAVINTFRLIHQLNLDDDSMQNEKIRLQEIINNNHWNEL